MIWEKYATTLACWSWRVWAIGKLRKTWLDKSQISLFLFVSINQKLCLMCYICERSGNIPTTQHFIPSVDASRTHGVVRPIHDHQDGALLVGKKWQVDDVSKLLVAEVSLWVIFTSVLAGDKSQWPWWITLCNLKQEVNFGIAETALYFFFSLKKSQKVFALRKFAMYSGITATVYMLMQMVFYQ